MKETVSKMAKYESLNKDSTLIIGDVVRLKSGGMPMTVEYANEGETKCIWFDAQNQCQRGGFRTGSLEKRK